MRCKCLLLLAGLWLFGALCFRAEARYYDARVGRFHQPDPKAVKIPAWSLYNYALANPVKYVDPDGQEVRFANGTSATFQRQFAAAVKYLNQHAASGMLHRLQESKTVYYINEGGGRSNYDPKKRTINWDPLMGVVTNEKQIVSPTTVLNHEVDHALQHDQNPKQFDTDRKSPDAQYQTKEEKRVIEGSEQETARKLGEISEGEVTRKDHLGRRFTTTGPTSTEPRDAIIVTSKKENEK